MENASFSDLKSTTWLLAPPRTLDFQYILGMKTLTAHHGKKKTWRDCLKLDGAYRKNWRAWREEIPVWGHKVNFKAKEIWKETRQLLFRFSSHFFYFNGKVNYICLIVNLHWENCLIKRIYMFTVIFLKCLKNLFKIALKLPCSFRFERNCLWVTSLEGNVYRMHFAFPGKQVLMWMKFHVSEGLLSLFCVHSFIQGIFINEQSDV